MKILHCTLLIFLLAFNFTTKANAAKSTLEDGLTKPYPAPEIIGIDQWFNSDPLKISALKNKIVLIDFWTYSCINCLRTLPHMNHLQEKYGDKGLVIIGVHSPEFEFEKNPQNVAAAIKRFGIKYAVAMDNEMRTWDNFSNRYWPAHYLINKSGEVVYTHFGEGKYDVMENNIRILLDLDKADSSAEKSKNIFSQIGFSITPETYLGLARGENNLNDSLNNPTFPKSLPTHGWALQGAWKINREFIESKKTDDALRLNFFAKKVFLVMASVNDKNIEAEIFLDGERISADKAGADVKNSKISVKESRLYELVNLPKKSSALLEIKVKSPGLRAYAFTFGGDE
jgi:thiol-disulfide isomerase/thioredoxin